MPGLVAQAAPGLPDRGDDDHDQRRRSRHREEHPGVGDDEVDDGPPQPEAGPCGVAEGDEDDVADHEVERREADEAVRAGELVLAPGLLEPRHPRHEEHLRTSSSAEATSPVSRPVDVSAPETEPSSCTPPPCTQSAVTMRRMPRRPPRRHRATSGARARVGGAGGHGGRRPRSRGPRGGWRCSSSWCHGCRRSCAPPVHHVGVLHERVEPFAHIGKNAARESTGAPARDSRSRGPGRGATCDAPGPGRSGGGPTC